MFSQRIGFDGRVHYVMQCDENTTLTTGLWTLKISFSRSFRTYKFERAANTDVFIRITLALGFVPHCRICRANDSAYTNTYYETFVHDCAMLGMRKNSRRATQTCIKNLSLGTEPYRNRTRYKTIKNGYARCVILSNRYYSVKDNNIHSENIANDYYHTKNRATSFPTPFLFDAQRLGSTRIIIERECSTRLVVRTATEAFRLYAFLFLFFFFILPIRVNVRIFVKRHIFSLATTGSV